VKEQTEIVASDIQVGTETFNKNDRVYHKTSDFGADS
jgi:hypothetical protein